MGDILFKSKNVVESVPELYEISDWNPQPWFSTGGTRAKKYLQGPDGKFYYFKRSQLKPGKDYKFEFWSEIIAYEVGQLLGFSVLKYDIAVDDDIMGCISESMINPDKEELIEGIKYLQAYDNTFNPDNTKLRNLYTFELIEKALAKFGLIKFIDKIIEIIVFDSLIGNSDRHQENWAFINEYKLVAIEEILPARVILRKPKEPAPIYDSGSSLGRELEEHRVLLLLQNEDELWAYIRRGKSEIHWNNQKLNHFDLIRKLLSTQYRESVINIIERVVNQFDGAKIAAIVNAIDEPVPESLSHYKLPDERKQLIIKMITLRVNKLKELLNERI